jgi:chemotaxis protein CheD
MAASETLVRMGELAVSGVPGDVLVSVGLGSCVGLALLDRRLGIAGLAHIVLPQSQAPMNDNPTKFADLAVPQLVAELTELGARQIRLEAVLVGGAGMFSVSSSSLEVGQRNAAAVRELLAARRIPVVADASGVVTVREAGELYAELEVVS